MIACIQPINADDILVIVANDSPVQKLTLRQLANIYQRKTLINHQGVRWAPLNLGADHPIRREFSQQLFKQWPEDMESYWNIQYFKGITPPYVVSSPEAMLRFVISTPGTIGYILPCHQSPLVRVVLTLPLAPDKSRELQCSEDSEE